MSVICLMLFMTIGMLSTGFSFKNAIESGLKDSTPYDASANLYIDEGEKANDIQKSLEYIGVKFNKEDKVVYYDLYTDNKTISEALNLNANMRSLMNYMKLSDYNKIRALDNQNAIELNKDEVLITSNYANTLEAIQNYVKNNDSIKIENKSYKIKDKKVIEENIAIDDSILDYIASNIVSNIRELQGAINKVISFSNLCGKEVTMELAKEALSDMINPNMKRQITIDYITETVADHFGITVKDLMSTKRNSNIAFPRHICMYLCRQLTSSPLAEIGNKLGNRHHSTILHGIEIIEKKLNDPDNNEELIKTLDVLNKKIDPQ